MGTITTLCKDVKDLDFAFLYFVEICGNTMNANATCRTSHLFY